LSNSQGKFSNFHCAIYYSIYTFFIKVKKTIDIIFLFIILYSKGIICKYQKMLLS